MTFIDTSALYALLDRKDTNHLAAASIWTRTNDRVLRTHSFVVVETCALVQRRLGMEAVRGFLHDLVPVLDVAVVDSDLLDRAGASLLAHGSRGVSLVDWTSFEMMRRDRIDVAFAFDSDFVTQGFQVLEAP